MIGSTGINASATGTTLIVTTISDTSYEPTETFSLVLSNPSNATIGVGTGIGTIQDNDTVCSDGFKDTDGQDNIPSNTDDEECDDGNIINDDGCTSLCKIES